MLPAPTDKEVRSTPPVPSKKEAGTTQAAPTKKEAGTIPPGPTRKEACTTSGKPTDPKQKGTPNSDGPATPSSQRSSSDIDDGTEDDEYIRCFVEWLVLHPDCKRMLDDETKMLAYYESKIGNTAVSIIRQAVNNDRELFIEAWAQGTAGVNAMCEGIVGLNRRLGNMSSFASGQQKWTADMDGGRRKRVCKE